MTARKHNNDELLELIAPNGKRVGDCTGEELDQFANFYDWLKMQDPLSLCCGPHNSTDTSVITQLLFAGWRELMQ